MRTFELKTRKMIPLGTTKTIRHFYGTFKTAEEHCFKSLVLTFPKLQVSKAIIGNTCVYNMHNTQNQIERICVLAEKFDRD